MLHHLLKDDNSGDHWGVSSSTHFLPGREAVVLIQLQDAGEQVRVAMTAEQAEDMAAALLAHATKVREAKAIHLGMSEVEIGQLTPAARAHYYEALAIQNAQGDGSPTHG